MRAEHQRSVLRLADVYAPIARDLEESRRIFRDELITDQAFIADLCAHVGHFHGKLLRPALLLLSARACGGVRPEHHLLAAVVEMVHIATLVHDDVLDEADLRRRTATVNRLWGNERAVLMGDFLISHAFHLCSRLSSQEASQIIGATAGTVCEGEMMQVANRGNHQLTEPQYLDIIQRKTATLLGACCLLGARFADADPTVVRQLRTFGESLGIAFQIIDDVLDLVGDEAVVGKSLGRDADMGKLTLPLIHHLANADADRQAEMLAILRGAGSQRRRRIAPLLHESGSLSYARQVARRFVSEAREALHNLPPSDARDSLSAMAEFALDRSQ